MYAVAQMCGHNKNSGSRYTGKELKAAATKANKLFFRCPYHPTGSPRDPDWYMNQQKEYDEAFFAKWGKSNWDDLPDINLPRTPLVKKGGVRGVSPSQSAAAASSQASQNPAAVSLAVTNVKLDIKPEKK